MNQIQAFTLENFDFFVKTIIFDKLADVDWHALLLVDKNVSNFVLAYLKQNTLMLKSTLKGLSKIRACPKKPSAKLAKMAKKIKKQKFFPCYIKQLSCTLLAFKQVKYGDLAEKALEAEIKKTVAGRLQRDLLSSLNCSKIQRNQAEAVAQMIATQTSFSSSLISESSFVKLDFQFLLKENYYVGALGFLATKPTYMQKILVDCLINHDDPFAEKIVFNKLLQSDSLEPVIKELFANKKHLYAQMTLDKLMQTKKNIKIDEYVLFALFSYLCDLREPLRAYAIFESLIDPNKACFSREVETCMLKHISHMASTLAFLFADQGKRMRSTAMLQYVNNEDRPSLEKRIQRLLAEEA